MSDEAPNEATQTEPDTLANIPQSAIDADRIAPKWGKATVVVSLADGRQMPVEVDYDGVEEMSAVIQRAETAIAERQAKQQEDMMTVLDANAPLEERMQALIRLRQPV